MLFTRPISIFAIAAALTGMNAYSMDLSDFYEEEKKSGGSSNTLDYFKDTRSPDSETVIEHLENTEQRRAQNKLDEATAALAPVAADVKKACDCVFKGYDCARDRVVAEDWEYSSSLRNEMADYNSYFNDSCSIWNAKQPRLFSNDEEARAAMEDDKQLLARLYDYNERLTRAANDDWKAYQDNQDRLRDEAERRRQEEERLAMQEQRRRDQEQANAAIAQIWSTNTNPMSEMEKNQREYLDRIGAITAEGQRREMMRQQRQYQNPVREYGTTPEARDSYSDSGTTGTVSQPEKTAYSSNNQDDRSTAAGSRSEKTQSAKQTWLLNSAGEGDWTDSKERAQQKLADKLWGNIHDDCNHQHNGYLDISHVGARDKLGASHCWSETIDRKQRWKCKGQMSLQCIQR